MDYSVIKRMLNDGVRIQDLPLRVACYARVSSERDEQLNSLDNQIAYYTKMISDNPNWEFAGCYIDEGISGKNVKKRDKFLAMIEDAKVGNFDFIITKDISRFARNTMDSLLYAQLLREVGVGVYFETFNLSTLDPKGEIFFTMFACFAQNELQLLSDRVKFGHRQAISNGVVLGNSKIFGYDKKDKKLVINEEEAPMIIEIFTLYATGEYSLKQLENYLWDKGYRNRNGNKIAHNTLANIITNPKYKGYYVGGKWENTDLMSSKRRRVPEEEWVMYRDETGEIVPAIVDEEIWAHANAIFKIKSESVKARQNIYNHGNLLTGKLICKNCGSPYYRKDSVVRDGTKNSQWRCSGKINNGAASCDSFTIYEDEIQKIIFALFSDLQDNLDVIIDEYAKELYDVINSNDIKKELEKLRRTKESLMGELNEVFKHTASKDISESVSKQMIKRISDNIERVDTEISDIEKQMKSKDELNKSISEIKKVLYNATKAVTAKSIGKDFVDKYIDKIYVSSQGANCAKLEVKLKTGDITEKFLYKVNKRGKSIILDTEPLEGDNAPKCRTGHTSKKMIQSYEQNMK